MMLSGENTFFVCIDFQERMLPHIPGHERMLKQTSKLVRAAHIFHVPIIHTEQRKLGTTSPLLGLTGQPIEKVTFSCVQEPAFAEHIETLGRTQCLLTGIETHICVLQTALDLQHAGYDVHVAVDCTGSRHAEDKEIAIQRLAQAGITVTTAETAIYELLASADASEFRDILKIIKEE